MTGDHPSDAAQAFGALARCHRRFHDAAQVLGRRLDVVEARRELYLHPVDGGARAELGVVALADARGARAGHWQLQVDWAAGGWSVTTAAFVAVKGLPAAPVLRPRAHWAGSSAAEFAAVVERAVEELVADVAAADIVGPEPPLATAAGRLAARADAAPEELGVPGADWVRAYVLDGMTEAEAERRVDGLLAPASSAETVGGYALGVDLLVPLARLGPPLSDALRTRLERGVAETEGMLAELRSNLERVRAITPPTG
jgi:hypothetical protein